MEYILILIGAVFVNNIVLSQFLGICPFLGVSKKIQTSIGMGAAVTFVMALATIVTFLIQKGILDPYGLGFTQTIVFILVIAALVQMVEIVLKKVSPALYQSLGVFLPLITTNCAVLGVAILVIQKDFTFLQSLIYAISSAIGFTIAMVVFAGIREQLAKTSTPKSMEGMPIALITAGILAMSFMGFSGMDKGLEAATTPVEISVVTDTDQVTGATNTYEEDGTSSQTKKVSEEETPTNNADTLEGANE